MNSPNFCPICKTKSSFLDVVDFNKSCEEPRGKYLPLSGIPVYYARCGNCLFCWAPELHKWSRVEFEKHIYNKDYAAVDPDYIEIRPTNYAKELRALFPQFPATARHLDYGGGGGLLAQLLRKSNWESWSYDPFVDKNVTLPSLGRFDLITAFEVFEHVPDVQSLMSDLCSLLANSGIVFFSTLLSDGEIQPNQRLSWWYASPRNGHISLFSKKALTLLAENSGLGFGSRDSHIHIFCKNVPAWASHFIQAK